MLKYLALTLCLLSLTWQVLGEEESSSSSSDFEVDDFGVNEFNDTNGNIVPRPRYVKLIVFDKTYTFNFKPTNWHSARELCSSQNQVIASINSHEESGQLTAALDKQGLLHSDSVFWIGASQLGHVDKWSWVSTGLPSSYENWIDGEPTHYCNRNCLELQADGRWRSNDCDQKRAVICQNLPLCNSYDQTSFG